MKIQATNKQAQNIITKKVEAKAKEFIIDSQDLSKFMENQAGKVSKNVDEPVETKSNPIFGKSFSLKETLMNSRKPALENLLSNLGNNLENEYSIIVSILISRNEREIKTEDKIRKPKEIYPILISRSYFRQKAENYFSVRNSFEL